MTDLKATFVPEFVPAWHTPFVGAILARAKGVGVTLFVMAFACAYYLINVPALLGHYDLGWHLAAGDFIRQHGAVPIRDPFSFTAGGKQWFNLSWGWDVLASVIYERAHLAGLVVLTVACGAAIAFCLAAITRRAGTSQYAAGIAALGACLLYPAFAAFPNIYLAASPNMATMLFTVIVFAACLKPSRWLLALPLVMLAWANLHGGFIQGLGLIGFFGLCALVKRDFRNFWLFTATGCLCLAATLVNPLGWHIYEGVAGTIGNSSAAKIGEWMPLAHNVKFPDSLPTLFYMLLFVVAELGYRTACRRDVRILSWLFLVAGICQFRDLAFFFFFSTIPMALWLDRLLPARRDAGKLLLAAGLAMTCALPVISRQALPGFELPQMVSKTDVDYLTAHYPGARLLNHWNFGGLILFYEHGRVPLFVDGRAATAYPESLLHDWFKLGREEVNPADWDGVLSKYRIDTVLWVKNHQALRHFLVEQRGWHEVYDGHYVSLYVRPKAANVASASPGFAAACGGACSGAVPSR
jgi:hypothetical protein